MVRGSPSPESITQLTLAVGVVLTTSLASSPALSGPVTVATKTADTVCRRGSRLGFEYVCIGSHVHHTAMSIFTVAANCASFLLSCGRSPQAVEGC